MISKGAKSLTAAILSVCMVLSLSSIVQAAEVGNQLESNVQNVTSDSLTGSGSLNDPWEIEKNTVISHETTEGKNTDYYTFTIEKKGCMKPYVTGTYSYNYSITNISVYSEEAKDANLVFDNENREQEFKDLGETGLKPGKYIVKIYAEGCTSYKFSINFKETDRYEEELDSPSNPKKISPDGEVYYGEASPEYGDTYDYYSFDLEKDSKITLYGKSNHNEYYRIEIYSDKSYSEESKVLNEFAKEFTKTDIFDAGSYYIKVSNGLSETSHNGYQFSITLNGGHSVSENLPMNYSKEERGDFRVFYNHEIPFYGKAKPTVSMFDEMTVSYKGADYKVKKIKVNKKKHLIQIIDLEGADANTVKAVKNATKGKNGLPFSVNPYYVSGSDKVTPKFGKDGSPKFVKVTILGKDYKAKKNEWDFNASEKIFTFKGNNLNGSFKAN